MNNHYKKLTQQLTNKLCTSTHEFLLSNIPDEENTREILDLVLSGHLSSAFTTMLLFSKEHPEMHLKVSEFISSLLESITLIRPIVNTEILDLDLH